MTEITKQAKQNTQESPDFLLTGAEEYLREGAHRMEQVVALGNIAMHLRFLTDSIYEMVEKQQETNETLKTIQGMLQDENENSIGVIATSAESQLNGIYNRLARIVVNGGNLNEFIDGVDTSLHRLAEQAEDACDPEAKRLRVSVDGMLHPY